MKNPKDINYFIHIALDEYRVARKDDMDSIVFDYGLLDANNNNGWLDLFKILHNLTGGDCYEIAPDDREDFIVDLMNLFLNKETKAKIFFHYIKKMVSEKIESLEEEIKNYLFVQDLIDTDNYEG